MEILLINSDAGSLYIYRTFDNILIFPITSRYFDDI